MIRRRGETKDNDAYEEELLDYEEDEKVPDSVAAKVNGESAKKGYVGIHSSGFRDFLLKPELLWAIVDSGFEHPSEVQHECIPQAILGMDVICQAKSGMGKTAVFVLSTLQQIEPVAGQVAALVLCHTRELAYQICHEFERFSTYLPDIKVAVFYGGVSIKIHKDLLKNECPHIVVGTPGRILALAREKDLSMRNVRHFILDECDKMLESLDMRRDVQEIFKMTPHDKQVIMFSATLSKEIRLVCKKFMQDDRDMGIHSPVLIFFTHIPDNLDVANSLKRLASRSSWTIIREHYVIDMLWAVLKNFSMENQMKFLKAWKERNKKLYKNTFRDAKTIIEEIVTTITSRLCLAKGIKHTHKLTSGFSKNGTYQTPHSALSPMEIYVDDEEKLTLHGLVQHYIKLSELEKNRKLNDLLDALDCNQVVIFVKSVSRAAELNKLLVECNFPSICIHSGMSQEERGFKEGHKRILVATDLVGRGIDIERVNIVINYDMPDSADTYLHRVGRAGRFGTKGLAITFVSSASDSDVLNQVQERFEVDIKELPEQIDTSTYSIAIVGGAHLVTWTHICMNGEHGRSFMHEALLNLFLIICIASFGVDSFPTRTFDVMQYGAAGDGHRDDTRAFVKAWKATCGASGGTPTLNVPSGKTFLLNPLAFEGPCKSPNVQIQWTLIAPGVDGLNIHGNGHINDQGSAWWGKSSYIDDNSDSDSDSHLDSNNYKAKSSCDRPMALRFHKCNRFELRSMLS
ncbi:unnamed protein product [Camellia sinensis]